MTPIRYIVILPKAIKRAQGNKETVTLQGDCLFIYYFNLGDEKTGFGKIDANCYILVQGDQTNGRAEI